MSPMGVFSYKHTDYTRIDQKRLDVDFSERTTIKRTIYPQGHLSGLFRELQQGLDLNRDYTKLESPELRALVGFFNQWDPAIIIDTHIATLTH
jgi:hypothetical protein